MSVIEPEDRAKLPSYVSDIERFKDEGSQLAQARMYTTPDVVSLIGAEGLAYIEFREAAAALTKVEHAFNAAKERAQLALAKLRDAAVPK